MGAQQGIHFGRNSLLEVQAKIRRDPGLSTVDIRTFTRYTGHMKGLDNAILGVAVMKLGNRRM